MKFLLFILLSTSIFAQTFEQQALQYLQKQFPEFERIEIQLQKNFSEDEKVTVDYSRNINFGRGTALIPVTTTKGLKTSSSIVSVKVQMYKKLFVASRTFDRKEILNKAEFDVQLIDVTKLNGNPVSADFLLSNYRTKSFIKKGEILFEEMLEKIPLVSAGDKVNAEVKNGNVTITTEAFARQQGSTGDLIELVSSNNKIIKARIVDANKVIVE
jgi:flagella basal body P-ring formation protein FlgA